MSLKLRCCKQPVVVVYTPSLVRYETNPPRTNNRWIVRAKWQCRVTEIHHGKWCTTTDDLDKFRIAMEKLQEDGEPCLPKS